MKKEFFITIFIVIFTSPLFSQRIRDFGIKIGILKTGKYNAITDVKGVLVGHKTIIKSNDIRTGITVILPHKGNIFKKKVPSAIYVGNGYGKLIGYTQVQELGTIETPIALTNTLNVWRVADALVDYVLSFKENKGVRSINPIVGETNDGFLNNIQKRSVTKKDVLTAIKNAHSGPVEEGAVGAGTGTICFSYKGGIGTSSRVVDGYTVGVLVQTNFWGILRINGYTLFRNPENSAFIKNTKTHKGSCMIVVATDAPLSSRNLLRLAKRAMLGLSRTGGVSTNGSGDYVIAFSTAYTINEKDKYVKLKVFNNSFVSTLFMAVEDATEEAILNSLFQAEDMCGFKGCVKAIPKKKIIRTLREKGLIQ